MELRCENKLLFAVSHTISARELRSLLVGPFSLDTLTFPTLKPLQPLLANDFYLVSNGRRVTDDAGALGGTVHLVVRCLGGKGGFGSMLRAIGAQIEKTTNREACRDLSGRRLRDINEEQRLKKWIDQQVDREKEAADKKQKKLERLMEQPRHEFRDAEYDKVRSDLPEKVEDAVIQGLQASCSGKRKSGEGRDAVKKKRPKLWLDDEFSDSDLDGDDDDSAQVSNDTQIVQNN